MSTSSTNKRKGGIPNVKGTYEIMHLDRRVARIGENGVCKIYYKSFLPYNLCLEEDTDIDCLVQNVTNFYYWCASRILTLDCSYAKEILNSIGVQQAVTDREPPNECLAKDLATNGCFPKAWRREEQRRKRLHWRL